MELTLSERLSVDISNKDHGHPATPEEHESTNKLLKRICDLLETRVHSEEEQRYEDDKENEMKDDWMLAAAVLDRILGVAIAVIFVAGTLMIFVVCVVHCWPLYFSR